MEALRIQAEDPPAAVVEEARIPAPVVAVVEGADPTAAGAVVVAEAAAAITEFRSRRDNEKLALRE